MATDKPAQTAKAKQEKKEEYKFPELFSDNKENFEISSTSKPPNSDVERLARILIKKEEELENSSSIIDKLTEISRGLMTDVDTLKHEIVRINSEK